MARLGKEKMKVGKGHGEVGSGTRECIVLLTRISRSHENRLYSISIF